jgi:hypothetical protein
MDGIPAVVDFPPYVTDAHDAWLRSTRVRAVGPMLLIRGGP